MNFYRATRRHIPEDITLHVHRFENFESPTDAGRASICQQSIIFCHLSIVYLAMLFQHQRLEGVKLGSHIVMPDE
jgi:hypothetical protein